MPLERSITPDVYWQSRLQLRRNWMALPRLPAVEAWRGAWNATFAFTFEPQPGAARDHAARHFLERLPDDRQARLRRVVDVVQPRLPLPAADLVEGVVEEHRLDSRLAEREAERLLVPLSLDRRGDGLRRRGLGPRVLLGLGLGDGGLDSVLVVDDRDLRADLLRPVEGLAERLHELVVVGDRDVGRGRWRVVGSSLEFAPYGWKANQSMIGLARPLCLVGLAEVADEDGRRV